MANKDNLKDKLGRRGAFAGWEDVVTQARPDSATAGQPSPAAPAAAPPAEEEIVRKTYLLYRWQVEQIADQAKAERIQLNEYLRALLGYVLEEVEAGRIKVSSGSTTVSRSKR